MWLPTEEAAGAARTLDPNTLASFYLLFDRGILDLLQPNQIPIFTFDLLFIKHSDVRKYPIGTRDIVRYSEKFVLTEVRYFGVPLYLQTTK